MSYFFLSLLPLSKWFNVLWLFFIEKGLLVYLIEKNEEGEKSFTFLNVRQ